MAIKSMYALNTRKDKKDSKPCIYGVLDISSIPSEFGDLVWSGKKSWPNLGDRVYVNMNGFGFGNVVAYFVEAGFLGIEVELENRPEWHIKQNGHDRSNVLIFGIEISEPVQIKKAKQFVSRISREDGMEVEPMTLEDAVDKIAGHTGLQLRDVRTGLLDGQEFSTVSFVYKLKAS